MSAPLGIAIRPVAGAADARVIALLVRESCDPLSQRSTDRLEAIDGYLEARGMAGEPDRMAREGPPEGAVCLPATVDGTPAGTLMRRRVTTALYETNQMCVTGAARGRGLSRTMVNWLIAQARGLDDREIRLEAPERRVEALSLFRSPGFLPDPDPTAIARSDPGIVSPRMTP